jgi:hypothetical protein
MNFTHLIDPIATYCLSADAGAAGDQNHSWLSPPAIWRWRRQSARSMRAFRSNSKARINGANPSDQCDIQLYPRASHPVQNLPDVISLKPGEFFGVIDGLSVD